jgi:dienelactone hydrolase
MIMILVLLIHPLNAQPTPDPTSEPTPPPFEPLAVEIEGEDGHTLHGHYFAEGQQEGRAVLLLHEMYTTHTSWSPLIYPLMQAGFKVLAVDLRGFGLTRGSINWTKAQQDTVAWVDWLEAQPGVTSVAMVGSSIGSALAITGCAEVLCVGAVAISPGINYYRVNIREPLQSGVPILAIYAENDPYPKRDMPQIAELGADHLTIQRYSGIEHGVALFEQEADLIPLIVQWIGER